MSPVGMGFGARILAASPKSKLETARKTGLPQVEKTIVDFKALTKIEPTRFANSRSSNHSVSLVELMDLIILENASPVDPDPSQGPAGRRVPEAFYNRDHRTAFRWFRIRRLAGWPAMHWNE
jgi:hypothetical protein